MEKTSSILNDLKQHFTTPLQPGLKTAHLIETEDLIFLEYSIQSTEDCLITYKHNITHLFKDEKIYTIEYIFEKGLKAFGFNQNKIDFGEIDAFLRYQTYDLFHDKFISNNKEILPMITHMFIKP